MFGQQIDGSSQPSRSVKRKRVSVACTTCRAHKIRCDGVRPRCGTCLRRRESCIYDDENVPHESPSTSMNNEDESGVTAMGLVSRPLSDDQEPMKGFFGDSSTIAFIQQLQDTFKPKTKGSELQEALRQPLSHTQESPKAPVESIQHRRELLPPRPLADHLVDCYFSKIHTLYPFVHKEAFLTAYRLLWEANDHSSTVRPTKGLGLGDIKGNQTTFYYGLNIIFALGCQFSNEVQLERESTSEAFFQRCKPALDIDYLETGDLALTQLLLLMAHYLQSSRTPNRCWHVIGTACRLAQGVGLHSDAGNERRSFAEIQIRRRVWHGCVMLDLAISVILGRPLMISHAPSTPLPDPIDDSYLEVDSPTCRQPQGVFSRVEWFIATLKLHALLRKAQSTLYDNTGKHSAEDPIDQRRNETLFQIQSIIQIDAELQDFRLEVPKPLIWDVPALEGHQSQFLRERYLLRARLLYTKLLIYRPVLSQSLRENLFSVESGVSNTVPSRTGIYANFNTDCSVLCVQSAIDLISLVHETCTTDLASVWFYNVFYVFTAGSITLLAELYSPIVDIVTREALNLSWEKCQTSLKYLKSFSVIAERCADSLSAIRSKCLIAMSEKNEQQHCNDEQLAGSQSELAPENFGQIPFSEDLFSDFDFDGQTFFDPFWFNLGGSNII